MVRLGWLGNGRIGVEVLFSGLWLGARLISAFGNSELPISHNFEIRGLSLHKRCIWRWIVRFRGPASSKWLFAHVRECSKSLTLHVEFDDVVESFHEFI
jgi:hypothetical protein